MLFTYRADYQKISQRLKERKPPPPMPGNVGLDNRPSLLPEQVRDRSDTIIRPLVPALPIPANYEVSTHYKHSNCFTIYKLLFHKPDTSIYSKYHICVHISLEMRTPHYSARPNGVCIREILYSIIVVVSCQVITIDDLTDVPRSLPHFDQNTWIRPTVT